MSSLVRHKCSNQLRFQRSSLLQERLLHRCWVDLKQLELVIHRRLSPAVLEQRHLLEVISRKRRQLRCQCLRLMRRPIRRLAKCLGCLGLHSSRPNV